MVTGLGPASGAPTWKGGYQTTRVKLPGWQEEEAWLNADGQGAQRTAATTGARAFGRRDPCSANENLARTNGRSTSHLTSWGHEPSWEHDGRFPDRTSRRAAVPPPSVDAMVSTLHGESLAPAALEPFVLASGHAIDRPLRASVHPSSSRAPFANDADPTPPPTAPPPPLFDSISGVVKLERTHMLPPEQLSIDPCALTPRAGAGEEYSATPRSSATAPRNNLFGALLTDGPPRNATPGSNLLPAPYMPPATPVMPPATPGMPPATPGMPGMTLSAEATDVCLSLHRALADRQLTWNAAFEVGTMQMQPLP